MTDRPIIFSAPMIRALLDGRKTQTRRLASSQLAKVQPGDRLWVREIGNWQAGGTCLITGRDMRFLAYAADADPSAFNFFGGKRRPSIHMPRWASRITLTVTEVRQQRLLEISGDDALAEGVEPAEDRAVTFMGMTGKVDAAATHIGRFGVLWEKLHGPGSWDANPEVIAITFTVARRNIDNWELVP